MVAVCLGLFLLNHSGGESPAVRWAIGSLTASASLIEAAYPCGSLLARGAIGAGGRGAAMGIYSVFVEHRCHCGFASCSSTRAGIRRRWLIYSTLQWPHCALFVRWIRPDVTESKERLMSKQQYDLVIIGAGAGGLNRRGICCAAPGQSGACRKDRIGGDCTWTGCVPASLLK